MLHAVLHAIEESIILLPFLFVCYILIELVESWTSKKSTRSLKNNKLQVLLGASLGLIPQCGFGVVATDLYSKKSIRMGTLIAIYIATSDEAIPVILSNPEKIGSLLPLLLFKFLFAIIAGYIVMAIEFGIEKKHIKVLNESSTNVSINSNQDDHKKHNHDEHQEHNHEHGEGEHDENDHDDNTIHIGCCGHEIDADENVKLSTKQKLKHYLWHPFMHTVYIFSFIVIVNIIFGCIIHAVGEDALSNFMNQTKWLTPVFAVLIGLIPNCASSVVLTNMFIIGSLPFGALLAGLISNAGIAVTVLFKQNKSLKQNLTIVGVCLLTALIAGYGLLFVF